MNSRNFLSRKTLTFKPPIGSQYEYRITEVKDVEQEIGGKNIVSTRFENDIGFLYRPLKVEDSIYTISVEFTSYHLNTLSGEAQETGLMHEDSVSFQRAIKAFRGAIFKFNLEVNGKVKNISGYENFKEKFDSFYKLDLGIDSPSIAELSFNKHFFADIFEKISGILPNKEISIDSSWVHMNSQEMGGPTNLKSVYTFSSVHDGIAHINTASPVEQQLSLSNHLATLKGSEISKIEIDYKTGMPLNSSKHLNISGVFKIGESEINMKVTRESKIIGKRID